jgi:hypothetical protein
MFKSKFAFLILFFSLNAYSASNALQVEGDPEVSATVNAGIKKSVLPEGAGCQVLPPKNNCDARLMCYAQSRIYNRNTESKLAAIDDAKDSINDAYIDLIEGVKKDRTKNCTNKVGRLMENNQGKERISKLCETIRTESTSGTVRGLEVISVATDWTANEVTVVMGKRCEGAKAIQNIKNLDKGLQQSSSSKKTSAASASSSLKDGEDGASTEATDKVEDRLYQRKDF